MAYKLSVAGTLAQPIDKTKTDSFVDDYIPTKKEEALLRILLDPYHRMASVTRICQLTGCSRDFFYTATKRAEFIHFYRQLCIGAIKHRSGQLIHIGLREVAKGGTQGLGYWKELMKMSMLIQDNQVNVGHSGETFIRFADPPE